MAKSESGGCCCGGQSKLWWGVLAGVVLAAALHVLVAGGCRKMCHKGGPGCGHCPVAAEKAPASK